MKTPKTVNPLATDSQQAEAEAAGKKWSKDPVRQYAFTMGYLIALNNHAHDDHVSVPHPTAQLVRLAFLPTNPTKMRNAAPEVVQAAKDFIAAVGPRRW